MALVQHHRATAQETKGKLKVLWRELAAELSPELISKAKVRGPGLFSSNCTAC